MEAVGGPIVRPWKAWTGWPTCGRDWKKWADGLPSTADRDAARPCVFTYRWIEIYDSRRHRGRQQDDPGQPRTFCPDGPGVPVRLCLWQRRGGVEGIARTPAPSRAHG